MEKRTIHISIGDVKVDLSLKSNAQLQCQARANEDTPRKCCSGTGNRGSKLTVKHCKPFKSSRAAVLISEETGLLASSFIFTGRESFPT